ncbi:hypothetical protein AAE478_006991 [Parahypoxylon ruwenzoriense]
MSKSVELNLSNVEAAPAVTPCGHCQAIVPDRSKLDDGGDIYTGYERIDLYPEFPGLLSSAEAGCHLCRLLQREFSDQAYLSMETGNALEVWATPNPSWDQRVKISVKFSFLPFNPVSPADNFHYHLEGSPPQYNGVVTSMRVDYKPVASRLRGKDGAPWNGAEFEFSLFDSPDLLATTFDRRRKVPSASSLSNENVGVMQRWIDDCKHNHNDCLTPPEPWVPTRLLEINYDAREIKLRLVETSSPPIPKETPFVALSHMWGGLYSKPPLRTVGSNYEQLKEKISGEDLPQTFLDSALVCYRLDIRYLWIDSLCIIQDSVEDWRHEAALMHKVYRHAIVTIVATSATSSHDGFLKRNIDTIPAMKIAYSIDHPGRSTVAKKRDSQYMIVCRYENPQENYRMFAVSGSKWNTRGWTMQERSLSTRSIHFCRNRIFYECRSCLRAEDNEPPQESDLINSVLWPRRPGMSFPELYEHWQLFLAEYCQRDLTVPTDKLPAIQSVAAEITAVTGSKYIAHAGMWRHNLRSEILWYPSSFGSIARPRQWRAPSWSWASVEGNVVFWQRSFRNIQGSPPGSLLYRLGQHPFEVLDTDEDYPDPRSEARGYLKVKALAKRISRIQRLGKTPDKRVFFSYDLIGSVWRPDRKGHEEVVFSHGKLDVIDDEKTIQESGDPLMYLHVNGETRATGLILQRDSTCSGAKNTGIERWRRVGIATLFVDRAAPAIIEESFSDGDLPQEIILI